jgi:predicted ATPase
MRIKKLHIRNFKSLVDFELEDLRPFCAFVGPNASGKSNIFEALEFMDYVVRFSNEAPDFFGGRNAVLSYQSRPVSSRPGIISEISDKVIAMDCRFDDEIIISFTGIFSNANEGFSNFASALSPIDSPKGLSAFLIKDLRAREQFIRSWQENLGKQYDNDYEQFIDGFSRIFVGKSSLNRRPIVNNKLSPDAANLSNIIGAIFQNEEKRRDFIEWLQILIPEFKKLEVKKSNLDGSYDFLIYEKGVERPFPRDLISDGTYNILALLTAVYQSDQPQFLCIEEPENGLHPQAIELLVDFFREQCEEKGHHVWLNTHSQTLVRHLEIEEVILVNKMNGATRAKQLTKKYNVDIRTDEAWLTNALGGGVL